MPTYGTEIFALNRIVGILKDQETDDCPMNLQMAATFLAIAQQPGITSSDLSRATGMAQSSVSRNTSSLGKYHRLGKEGLKLIEDADDPRERRRKVYFLTPRGRIALVKMVEVITGSPASDLESPSFAQWERAAYGLR